MPGDSYIRALLYSFCFYSVSAAPYRSRSVVNLHHQDTETDEATMVLPPADYCDVPQRNAIKNNTSSTSNVATNNNHQHSPTPSAASSLSSDHNTVSQWATTLVNEHSSDILHFSEILSQV